MIISREPHAHVVGGRLASQVYEDLKKDLLAGRYEPGSDLTVARLREEYAVSKQPVMEALRALAADRLVEIQPQVGVRVSRYTEAETAAFFLMFSRTEGAMANRAARLRTNSDLLDLEALCLGLEALETSGEPNVEEAYLRGNREVHSLIHSMAGSPLTSAISAGFWDLSDFLIATHTGGIGTRLPARNTQHREVLDAIRAGDAEGAEEAMARHIIDARRAGQPI